MSHTDQDKHPPQVDAPRAHGGTYRFDEKGKHLGTDPPTAQPKRKSQLRAEAEAKARTEAVAAPPPEAVAAVPDAKPAKSGTTKKD